MKKKCTTESALLSLRLLVVCAAGCLFATGTLLAIFRSGSPATTSHPAAPGLTFTERVAYQRAIEEVYWRHPTWPKENPDPKPSLDAVMSQAQIEKKVANYLRKLQLVVDQRGSPITASELQLETERMASHTKQPEVLREVFDVMGNDPFVTGECLAGPILAERLLAESKGGSTAVRAMWVRFPPGTLCVFV